MNYLKKTFSLFLCLLMGITGPVISNALADGHGNTLVSPSIKDPGGKSAAPCTCPNCPSKSDATDGSSGKRGFFYNGSESLHETDLFVPGTFPFSIQRIYSSQSTYDSPLGYGWDISQNERLKTYKDNSVIIRNPSGVKISFIYTGGAYVCETNPRIHLIQNEDGSFEFSGQSAGLKHYYDREGKLIRIQNASGSSFHMQYSLTTMPLTGMSPNSINPDVAQIVSYDYQLQRIEQWNADDTFTGRYVEFSYDVNTGRLNGISDWSGNDVTYLHDSLGNLLRVTYPEGLYKSYSYDDPNDSHNITASGYGYGSNNPLILTTREYDQDDRLTKEMSAGGNIIIDYTIPLQKTKVTKTVVDSNNAVLHQSDTLYEFNTDGYLVKITDDQRALEYIRDNRNNIIEKVVWENTGSTASPNLVKKLSVTFIFNEENQITSSAIDVEDGEKIINSFKYQDGVLLEQQMYHTKSPDKIHKLTYEYNYINNNPTTLKRVRTLTTVSQIPTYTSVSFDYNNDGQQTTIQFDNGDKLTIEYENGLLSKKDGLTFQHDSAGQITAITDRNGNTTHYDHDNAGRTVKTTNPLGQETIYTYTGWQLTKIEQGKTTENAGIVTNFSYDEYGRIVSSSVDLNGSDVIRRDEYNYDSDGNILSVMDQLGHTNSFSFDPWGRLISSTDSRGNSNHATYTFAGALKSVTDAEGNTTSYQRDLLGRLIQTTDALGGVTSVLRDDTGQINEITDSEGRVFQFAYDLTGRKTWQESPSAGRDTYTYDTRGRVTAVQHQDGSYNTYQYNINNQIEQVILNANTDNRTIIRYGHDKMGNLIWYSDSSVGQDAFITMTYDELNRLKSKTLMPINKTLQIDYTGQGQRQKLSVLDGNTELFSYFYSYDTGGRLTAITEQPVNKTTSFTYDASGNLIKKLYANGSTTSFNYSPSGILSSIDHQKSDTTTINTVQYAMDGMNKITAISDNQGVTSYSYDALGRLVGADYPAGSILVDEQYTYDSTGNRLTSNNISDWTYNNDGRLLSYGNVFLTYDVRGRQISETIGSTVKAFGYDTLDRLTEATGNNSHASYAYDNLNHCIMKNIDNLDTWYLYDGSKIIAEFNNSGQLTKNYSYRPGTYDLLAITENGNFKTILTDHRQAPQYAMDDTESILWQANYQAFGEALIDNDVDNNGTSTFLSSRLPGQFTDETTGYNDNWHRSYNPLTGRFTTPDPSGLTGGLNLYSYGMNDPVSSIDPTGNLAVTAMILGTTAVIGMIGFATTYDSKEENYAESLFVASVSAIAVPIAILAAPVTIAEMALFGASMSLSATVAIKTVNKSDECFTIDELTQAILIGGVTGPLGPLFSGGGKISEELGGWFAGQMLGAGLSLNSFDAKEREINNQLYCLRAGQTKDGLAPYELIHDGKHPTEEIKRLELDLRTLLQARAVLKKRVENYMTELQIESGLLRSIEDGNDTQIDLYNSTTSPVY